MQFVIAMFALEMPHHRTVIQNGFLITLLSGDVAWVVIQLILLKGEVEYDSILDSAHLRSTSKNV